ncbi:MAG: beta-propeller fold lactonase family protein [Candidatus Latescibacteria bacterium]|nr:beta-propeller fold lactonase family protein [Candidatus Latescibacterota bacterium]
MAYHVYISNSGSDFFSHFLMDENSGKLSPQADIQLEGGPGAVATNPNGDILFAALRSAKQLASYRVNKSTGQLDKIGGAHLEEGPPFLGVDNTCSYLLTTYYGSGQVGVHGIGPDGTPSAQPLQMLQTDGHAHSIQTDRSNRFAFVPHTNPANAIYQFRFDENTGQLSPNEPAKIQPEKEEGPRHFAFHPSRDILYSINENNSTVSAHHFNTDDGTLESFQVISTLPPGLEVEDNTTAEIRITPDARFLYGSNRGHDSLALFTIGQEGELSFVDTYPTEATPRFFELDPSGRFIYSVGQKSGGLQSYSIDAASGALQPLERFAVGQGPLWVTFIEQV